MKTTIEISDALLAKTRRYAHRKGLTMRAIIEQGLRQVLADTQGPVEFSLPDASVSGYGLHPDVQEADWDRIRAAAYEGRGG